MKIGFEMVREDTHHGREFDGRRRGACPHATQGGKHHATQGGYFIKMKSFLGGMEMGFVTVREE